jgi:outer membrane lipopolysaccharide assembly protein LptE/RlpB
MRIAALLLIQLLLIAGCGYQFTGGGLPGDVRLLHLPLAFNETSEPRLENVLAAPLTAVLARQKAIVLVESESGSDAVLQATIMTYDVVPLSYDSNDRISQYSATLTVHFTLKQQKDGKLLWQGDLQRQQSYTAALDKNQQEDLESIAIETMAKDLADDLLYRLVTRF